MDVPLLPYEATMTSRFSLTYLYQSHTYIYVNMQAIFILPEENTSHWDLTNENQKANNFKNYLGTYMFQVIRYTNHMQLILKFRSPSV